MGDRVSIQFVKGKDKSVALFSHWGGMDFVKSAKEYVKELDKEVPEGTFEPLDRREPDTVMVDFIRWYTKDMDRVKSDLYLGADENCGDNGDNGHHLIKLTVADLL